MGTDEEMANLICSREPAFPDRIVAEVPMISTQELHAAIAAGSESVPRWRFDTAARSHALQMWSDRMLAEVERLTDVTVREVGKPVREARAEVLRAVGILRYYAQAVYDPIGEVFPGADGTSETIVRSIPVGVVAAICPWNFPVAIPVWKIAPALAYGNAVVFKPASAAVGTAKILVELSRPDVPEDVLAFAPMPSDRVSVLLDDPEISAVSFTGSEQVGHQVIQRVASREGAVQAEMGGVNASVVLGDADLHYAAATITGAAMSYAGQKCTATSRIVVERQVAHEFADQLVAAISELRVGDPADVDTDVGPLIDATAHATVSRSVTDALQRGASVVASAAPGPDVGWFYPPTVLAVSNPADTFMQSETFGPVAALYTVDSADEAIQIANGTRYGLSAAVFGSDSDRTRKVADSLHAGMVRINGSTTGADFWTPFGGEGDSGYGPREQGRAAREFFTHTRTLTVVQVPRTRDP